MGVSSKILTWASVNRDDPEEWAQFCCELYIEGRRNVESYRDSEDDALAQLARTWIAAERVIAPDITNADLDRLYLKRRTIVDQKARKSHIE
jgi:hypothetical protein